MHAFRSPFRSASVLVVALALAGAAGAQPIMSPPPSPVPPVAAVMTTAQPQNVLTLAASGQVEVTQDLLTLTLAATREGADAAGVQAELRRALDAALAQVRPAVQPGQMDLHTGAFSVNPRYNREGRITGWQGRAELVLEGRDFPRITQAASRAGTMTIADMGFGLSREARARVEAEAQGIAIERFRAKAGEIARAFGFSGYTLREVNVGGDAGAPSPRMYAMAATARGKPEDAPVAAEPGKAVVRISVTGSVQAH